MDMLHRHFFSFYLCEELFRLLIFHESAKIPYFLSSSYCYFPSLVMGCWGGVWICFARASSESQSQELASEGVYMADAVGTLKVLVVRGKRLVIRDFTSSDPYVVVRLGNQTLKTKVINSCLNPVWNEELTFTVTEPVGVLKLEVFDRDTFKADDKMGHTHVNLQPIAQASRLRRALRLSAGETKLRKVAPDADNCLLAESFIAHVDGEIVQDVRLRLCDVESGELELKLRWFDHEPSDAPAAAAS